MTESLRVVFAGTPEFAAAALEAVRAAGFAVPLVLTQPDRPAGRGMKLAPGPVKRIALEYELPIAQPASLRRDGKYPAQAQAALELLRATPHEVMVVAAYGLLLPQEVLDLPRYGCINIHASLLPRWRGAAPIHRAIEAGDSETGITLMQMDAGLDTGPTLLAERLPIEPMDTTGTLHNKLAALGARLIVTGLAELQASGKLAATPQPGAGVTYAEKIAKREALLDWRRPAPVLARQVRAFDPFPGGVATLDGVALKAWAAHAVPLAQDAPPGTIVAVTADGVTVACGSQAVLISQWQKPGGKRLPAREFLGGTPLQVGQCFALP